MPLDADLAESLGLRDLPAAFERFRVVLAPGDSRPTRPADWAGCLVLVERGSIEVDCDAGGSRSFAAGDLLALDWLPLRTLRSSGADEACLLAIRRCGEPSDSPIRVQGETTR
jgi:hypothetical protein